MPGAWASLLYAWRSCSELVYDTGYRAVCKRSSSCYSTWSPLAFSFRPHLCLAREAFGSICPVRSSHIRRPEGRSHLLKGHPGTPITSSALQTLLRRSRSASLVAECQGKPPDYSTCHQLRKACIGKGLEPYGSAGQRKQTPTASGCPASAAARSASSACQDMSSGVSTTSLSKLFFINNNNCCH